MRKLIEQIIQFRNERDWEKFHTPGNLAKSISIEAGELLEHFQWDDSFDPQSVKDELADVMIYCVLMAEALDVDIQDIMKDKMKKNEMKYPVDKAKGNSRKYDHL